MQSSVGVAARALILLVSLVGLPLVAVFGAAPHLPALSAGPLELLHAWHGEQQRQQRNQVAQNPQIAPFRLPDATLRYRPGVQPLGLTALEGDAGAGVDQAPQVTRWAAPPPAAASGLEGGEADLVVGAGEVELAAYAADGDEHRSETPPAADETAAAPQLNGLDKQRIEQLEQRLRSLGARHYVLELWGPDHELFRFHSRVALEPHLAWCRHFEAIDADPLSAMQRVLDEIEVWHASRAQ